MSESASALFSIADAREFRFARFYIVCEEVPLGTPESPPIVSGVSDMTRGLSKRGRDTESDADIRSVRNAIFFDPNFQLHFHMKSPSVFLIVLLIKARYA